MTSPSLIADIGATHVRLALVEGRKIVAEVDEAWGAPPDLPASIRTFLEAKNAKVETAAMAIAAPVVGDEVWLPNVLRDGKPYQLSAAALKKALGFQRLVITNDAAATALGLPLLTAADKTAVGAGQAVEKAPVGLVAPGTGLGIASLVHDGKKYIPVPGEGGHVTMAAVTQRESAALDVLRKEFGHVSAERVASGIGLPLLYRALGTVDGRVVSMLSASGITQRASLGTDRLATEAVNMFCEMLGTVAGNLALTIGARGGVYLAGGILPKIQPFFVKSGFRARFEAKGRYERYMAPIPTWLVTHPNPAYLGLIAMLEASNG